jgi:polysaccharide biosynthesis/export protein
MVRALICGFLAALSLAACSGPPLGRDVIAQATPDGQISFDVVKIDDAVLATLQAQRQPGFPERFKKYIPPPALKIGVGDVVSVVIWEAAANGLFGESLTEISLPPGAVARRLLSPATPQLGSALPALRELAPELDLSARLSGEFASSLNLSATNFGGQSGQTPIGATGQLPSGAVGQLAPLVAGGVLSAQALASVAPGGVLPAGAPAAGAQTRAGGAAAANETLETLLEAAVQSGRPGTRIPPQQVGADGAISIPYAGRVAAAGRTPEEVERAIEGRLAGKAIEPQALVTIRRNLANSVSVAGEVVGGARVALSPGGDRLLQVIAAAGGEKLQQAITETKSDRQQQRDAVTDSDGGQQLVAAAAKGMKVDETFVRLSRGGVTATVPLATLVADPDQDIFAEPGDVLTLIRRPQTFSVFGATGKNSAITFNSEKLSLSEALAKAGGLLDDRADPSAVFLFRYEPLSVVRALGQPVATEAPPDVSPIVYRLDLSDAKSYLFARQFPVRDKDIIFVADAESRPVYKFFLALSQIAGPVETGLITCANARC